MDLTIFKGIITGLLLSIPFGPVGIYCMEKTLLEGQKKGYISALGMITVDVIYGLTALLFISQVEDTIKKYELYLQILIEIFLIFVGWKKFSTQEKIRSIECTPAGMIKDYFTTFFIALANISSIFTIVVIFTTLKVYGGNHYRVAAMAASGIFLGGATEWFITTFILSHFTKVLDEDKLLKISRISGVLIFLFGIFIAGNSLLKIL
ncbi:MULTISPECIES: LysE family transporter [unclassified Fusobacterium]|uniref:LysE family translocator n=1 Tax=unclassified Fusobacterium TaxID=2648384 RepID=UPI001B8DA9F6|nr:MULTISPECIES: LysE family transporter [unclassified Fusobacterium]MBR8700399.1 hypothetical protein [Fusobacterium sp. DD45]MBR8710092.1 hypothetical protein [Fusobacterium sp. DD28]MBR8750670.1 hypothetical protein [Fusobacterium sp. DD26]